MCIYTHMHTTKSDAHYKTRCYTNSSRGNKVGLLEQITKNKNSHLQWLWSFLYVHKEWIVTKKKGTVLEKEKEWAKPSWSNGNAVMFYTILSVIYFSHIDLISVFGYLTFFFIQVIHNKLNKTTVKALFNGRCQRSQNPWPGSELPCTNQYSLNVWNRNWKKKTFLKHLNVVIHSRSGCHFFLWAPYWRVLLSAVFLLPVGWMASC